MAKRDKHEHIKLKRTLGLKETTLCGVGIILGAGIYALVGKAAGLGGNAVWISFVIAAAVAALTGLSYAELSSLFPKAGAEYVYTRKSFSKWLAFLIGWLVIVGGIIAGAAVALGFAGYFSALFGAPVIPAALGLIALVSFINFYGIKQSARAAIIMTLIEVGGLLLIIFIGLPHLGSVNYMEMATGLPGIMGAAALIFFAFIGFEDMVRLSEETRDPSRIIPKALILSILITTILYMLVAISAVSIMGWEALGASGSPLADVAALALGNNAFLLLSVIALFSTANTVLLILLATARIVYGMADSHSLPSSLGRVHISRRTPWVATFLVMIFAMLFTLMGDIAVVASLTNFTIFITFIVINAAVIVLRYKQPGKRVFRIPINIGKFPVIPLVGALSCAIMLLNLGLEVLLYGVALTALGYVLYLALKKTMPRSFMRL